MILKEVPDELLIQELASRIFNRLLAAAEKERGEGVNLDVCLDLGDKQTLYIADYYELERALAMHISKLLDSLLKGFPVIDNAAIIWHMFKALSGDDIHLRLYAFPIVEGIVGYRKYKHLYQHIMPAYDCTYTPT